MKNYKKSFLDKLPDEEHKCFKFVEYILIGEFLSSKKIYDKYYKKEDLSLFLNQKIPLNELQKLYDGIEDENKLIKYMTNFPQKTKNIYDEMNKKIDSIKSLNNLMNKNNNDVSFIQYILTAINEKEDVNLMNNFLVFFNLPLNMVINKNNDTILHFIMLYFKKKVEYLNFILNSEDLLIKNNRFDTPLHFLFKSPQDKNNIREIFIFLDKNNISINNNEICNKYIHLKNGIIYNENNKEKVNDILLNQYYEKINLLTLNKTNFINELILIKQKNINNYTLISNSMKNIANYMNELNEVNDKYKTFFLNGINIKNSCYFNPFELMLTTTKINNLNIDNEYFIRNININNLIKTIDFITYNNSKNNDDLLSDYINHRLSLVISLINSENPFNSENIEKFNVLNQKLILKICKWHLNKDNFFMKNYLNDYDVYDIFKIIDDNFNDLFIKNKQMEVPFVNELFKKYQDEKGVLFNKTSKTKNGVKLKI